MPFTPAEEAAFLKRWAKKKTITHYAGRFWAAGRYMTQIEHSQLMLMIEQKLIRVVGLPKPMYDAQTVALMTPAERKKMANLHLPGNRIEVL